MRATLRTTAFLLAFSLALPALSAAQDGFALKVGGVFNSTDVKELETDLRLSDAAGWSVGAELLLPLGLAVGVSGYTTGSPDSFDFSEGSLVALADANYFLRLPLFPVAPYAGLHVGLGTYTIDDVREGLAPDVDFGDVGFQVGVRLQAMRTLGIAFAIRSSSCPSNRKF